MARCLALLGMVATHVLVARDPDGSLSFGQALAGGRASALFAVLAGVSIALMTGRRLPVTGSARGRASAGLAVRAVLVAAVGLVLGEVGSGIAVILTYYGVVFVLALPFLGLSARSLALLAAGWLVVAPVVSHLVRPSLPERQYASPTWGQLVADPGGLLAELTFTGYYPAVPWLAYVLAGMAVGRLDLTSRRTAGLLVAGGAAAALLATAASRVLTAGTEVQRALLVEPPAQDVDGAALLDRIAAGLPGTTPTGGSWQWLLVVAPHTATPFDLLQTTGSALLVIGAALLALSVAGAVTGRAVALFFGAGAMTLTLYSVHVVARSQGFLPDTLRDSYLFHVLLLLGIGSVFAATRSRGPLEGLVGAASRAAAGRSGP
ncbi:hypothetical protein ASG94_20760 [Nocardioides sp. Soil805]|nr:hypothetical protein ASG94_20760 [Nocardioides sp. Soil805]